MACLDQNSLLGEEGGSLPGAGRCWRGGQRISPGQEEGRVRPCLGSPRGAQLCSCHPVSCPLVSLGKLSFSVSSQEVLSTHLSPRPGQASMLCLITVIRPAWSCDLGQPMSPSPGTFTGLIHKGKLFPVGC